MATAHLCLKCLLPLYRRTEELGSFGWLAPLDLLLSISLLPKEDLVPFVALVMVVVSGTGSPARRDCQKVACSLVATPRSSHT